MASITRYNGKWRAVVHRKHIYKSKVLKTRGTAQTWARRIEQEIDAGVYVDKKLADKMTLSSALDKYVETVSVTKKNGRRTQVNEGSTAKQIKLYPVAKLTLSQLRSADLATFRDQRAKSVGANSVRLSLALISHLFTVAKQEWGMDYLINPCTGIKKPRVSQTARNRRLEGDEEARLLDEARIYSGPIHDIIIIAVETAMRRGEIAGIKEKDLNLVAGKVFLPDTKNNTARTVFLSSLAKQAFESLLRNKSDEQDSCIIGITGYAIGNIFRKLCKRTESPIEDLRFHDLRHEATSRLFEKGLSTEEVMSMTGHKTYQCLYRYTHLKPSSLHSKLG